MDYYGLLFLYYLKGLSGKSVLRLFFNIEAGGTEQLLPENTSTPTTTPILADIQYPDGLRTDQYFTYRETPTTVSNKARIKTIKGNTLVWNQLVKNGNFADTSNWGSSPNISINASNNILQVTNTAGRNGDYYSVQNIPMKAGHKYYFHAEAKKTDVSTAQTIVLVFFGEAINSFAIDVTKENTNWVSKSTIFTCASNTFNFVRLRTQVANATNEFKNVVLIDLTQIGLDISSPSDFTSLFPLSYYAYNQGSLLSFNGNGIKTVGKNLLNLKETTTHNGITFTNDSGVLTLNGTATGSAFFTSLINLPKGYYNINAFNDAVNSGIHFSNLRSDGTYSADRTLNRQNISYTYEGDIASFIIYVTNGTVLNNFVIKPMISFETPTSYEPYTSSTLSLPISTYFPTGMKSAGTVYDELTPTKAITRIGVVDLGSLEWTSANTSTQGISRMRTASLENVISKPSDVSVVANVICVNYETLSANRTYIKNTGISVDSNGDVLVYDPNYNTSESVASFKQAMSGVYLYYELATPTETPITTEDANEALSLLMGKSVSSNNAKQMIDIITKGE